MAGRLKVVAVTVSLSGAVFLAESAGTVADASSAQVQRVEHITGSAARAYLEGKSRTVPGLLAAYAKSDAELRAMGFKKTDTVVVVRRYRPAAALASTRSPFQRAIEFLAPNLYAQTASESNGDGEVIYTSWDDGNDGTWEGQQFFQDYADGFWELTNLQEDINEDPIVLFARLTGSRDGRERDRQGLQPADLIAGLVEGEGGAASGPSACENGSALFKATSTALLISRVSGSAQWNVYCDCDCSNTFANRVCIQQEIATCNLTRCGASAWPCRRTGPGFKLCMIVRCVGTSVTCSIDYSRCYRNKCNY